MKLTLIIGAILLLVAGGFGVNRLMWRSPDYAATGTCTADEIGKTYAALQADDEFRRAAYDRTIYEFWAYHPHLRRKEMAFEQNVNVEMYARFGKRKTAAYLCNHISAYFDATPRLRTVADIARAIRPFVKDEAQAWQRATCAATLGSLVAHPVAQPGVDHAAYICAERKLSRRATRRG